MCLTKFTSMFVLYFNGETEQKLRFQPTYYLGKNTNCSYSSRILKR